MRELAMVINNWNKEVTLLETIDSIRKAGFNNVFLQWYDENVDPTQEEQAKLCKQLGLKVIFAHLGYQNINSIWIEGEEGDKLVERYKKNIRECKEHGIELVIMHLMNHAVAPMYNEIGLERVRKIVKYAKELDVRIAFENTRKQGYLEYILNNIKSDNIGICFDAGHYHVHFNDEFDFEFFKDKIFAVHLHDNDKSDDLHLMPFDGTLDWKDVMRKLKECNYSGPITMELCYRYDYLNMSLDDFYRSAYEKGEGLRELMEG